MSAACAAGMAALFVHTILLLLMPGLLAAMLFLAWRGKDRGLLPLAGVAALALVVVAGLYAWHTRPLLAGWNKTETWSYSPLKSLVASVSKLGWPVALLAGLGAVVVVAGSRDASSAQREQDWYWLLWGSFWLAGCLVLPLLLKHHPAYSFPLTLGVLVLAGRGVCHVYQHLAERSQLVGFAWVTFACLLNMPSLASHYLDGSCSNYREAARHLRQHWQSGDRVIATSTDLLRHYLGQGIEPGGLELYDTAQSLEQLRGYTQQPGRLWIVVNHGRANRPVGLLDWLGKHCTRELDLSIVRLDAFEYNTTVYLHPGGSGSPSWEPTLVTHTQDGKNAD
jgi:hypothetical protein